LQESRQNRTSAASGVAYADSRGAINLFNWTEAGPKSMGDPFAMVPRVSYVDRLWSSMMALQHEARPGANLIGAILFAVYFCFFWPLWEAIGHSLKPADPLDVSFGSNFVIIPAFILYWMGGPAVIIFSLETAPYATGAAVIIALSMAIGSNLKPPAVEACLLISLCMTLALKILQNRLERSKREGLRIPYKRTD